MLDLLNPARPLRSVQQSVASGFQGLLRPADPSVVTTDWVSAVGDDGLFGPHSPAWRVHGELATLVGGIRALLLQTLHPLAMAGVADHSSFRSDPFGRLHRTAGFLAATVFGTTADAERAIEVVKRVHVHVRGTSPDGRAYSATDPHLLTFVHVTEVDSFLASHQVYADDRLTAAESDRYVADMAEVCRRLGGEAPPESVAELRAWLDAVRPELAVGAQARDALRFILFPPLPLAARPGYGLVTSAAVGLLPLWAQRQLLLPSLPPVDRMAVRPSIRATLATLKWAVGTSPHKELALARTAAGGSAA